MLRGSNIPETHAKIETLNIKAADKKGKLEGSSPQL